MVLNMLTCQFQAGEEFMTFSTLTCTVSNTLTPSIKALGTVTLPLAFNVGGTGSSVDLEDSKCFTAGTNTVTFNDGGKKISINVDFERSNVDPKGYLTDSRVIPSLNKVSTLCLHHNVQMVTHLVQWDSLTPMVMFKLTVQIFMLVLQKD